jgi:adenosyl cobinamide kinase/adenosyl cobinamide phosphate guanylyltransferase
LTPKARRLVFVTGAARSGKSSHAEGLASSSPENAPVLYVATAEARDEEMRERILAHRERRPEGWRTLEARRGVAERLPVEWNGTVLLDCLSLLVSNILLDAVAEHGEGLELEGAASREVATEVDALLGWWEESGSDLIAVSNEIGWGVVPPHRLGRVYRDLLGSANQRLAARSTEATLLVAGIPISLKKPGGEPE